MTEIVPVEEIVAGAFIRDLDESAPIWARQLNANLALVAESNLRAEQAIQAVKAEVGPIVESLSNHPMLRMLFK